MKSVTPYFLGSPFNLGQSHAGVAKSPAFFRQHSEDFLGHWRDLGDVLADAGQGISGAQEHAQKLSARIEELNLHGKFLGILGGDHAQSLGTIHGLLSHYSELTVVWIDAHADANVPSTSPSGNAHGMILSWLLGATEGAPAWMKHHLKAKNLVYVGVREIDPFEQLLIEELGITWIRPKDLSSPAKIWQSVSEALRKVDPAGRRPVHVSLDVDAMDSSIIQSTGTPVNGGLSIKQVSDVLNCVGQLREVVSAEIVELNPDLGTEEEAIFWCHWAQGIFAQLSEAQVVEIENPIAI